MEEITSEEPINNTNLILDFLDGKSLKEQDFLFMYFFDNIFVNSIIKKDQNSYLIFQDNNCFIYSIEVLKKIIFHLQKTIDNITNEDLIVLQKQRRLKLNTLQKYQSPIPKIKNKNGKIYILKAIGKSYYKIGKTINLNERINKISPALPFKTRLVHTIISNNIYKTELSLHKKFNDKRTNGEWFNLSKNDIKSLYKITNITEE